MTTVPRVITIDWLVAHEACEVETFRATFGASAELTRANALKAAQAGLDLDWLAEHLMDGTVWRAYQAKKNTTWRAHVKAMFTARRAYEKSTATAWRDEEATATAWRAYEEATATAWRAYEEIKATALCDALEID